MVILILAAILLVKCGNINNLNFMPNNQIMTVNNNKLLNLNNGLNNINNEILEKIILFKKKNLGKK